MFIIPFFLNCRVLKNDALNELVNKQKLLLKVEETEKPAIKEVGN
jgi:hypothetical protein